MYDGDELIITNDASNVIILQVINDLIFRNDQDFDANYFIAYNSKYTITRLLKKVSTNRFKVVDSIASGPGLWSMIAFSERRCDVYWLDNKLYDLEHNILFEVDYEIARIVNYRKDTGYIITHLKNKTYISTKTDENVILLSPEKHVIFLDSQFYYAPTDSNTEIYRFDSIVFKNFKLTEDLLQELKQLETVDEMKEMILRELTMSVI
jgi:hypothetical protein